MNRIFCDLDRYTVMHITHKRNVVACNASPIGVYF
jgi:hypothetical protein